ncbi:ARID DNA-binding domain-containing protein [Tanacetum coccineum]
MGASKAAEKGKEKLEHFGIKLEKEEDCKQQQTTHYEEEQSQMTCYKCQDFGNYAFECPSKDRQRDQVKDSSYKGPSTSKLSSKGNSHSTLCCKSTESKKKQWAELR